MQGAHRKKRDKVVYPARNSDLATHLMSESIVLFKYSNADMLEGMQRSDRLMHIGYVQAVREFCGVFGIPLAAADTLAAVALRGSHWNLLCE